MQLFFLKEETPVENEERKRKKLPKNFLVVVASMTSTTPGRSCSMEGTWLARIPISPETAAMLTWVTETSLKRVYKWLKIFMKYGLDLRE
jgi:hypothetical protein